MTRFSKTDSHNVFDNIVIAGNIRDAADTTKEVTLDLTAITTGTVRVLTLPDATDTLVGRNTTDTLTNKTLVAPKVDYVDYSLVAAHAVATGEMTWNADEGTFDAGLEGGVILQVGQENHIRVKAAENVTDGDVVYASGAVGASGKIEVRLYIANNTIEEIYVLGVATEDITLGSFGYISTFGAVRGIPTDGAAESETWIDGDVLYASPTTAGQLTKIIPVAPNQAIPAAMVVTSHASSGTLFVRPSHGFHLYELHDVFAVTPVDSDFLMWNNGNTRWENTTFAAAGLATLAGTETLSNKTLTLPQINDTSSDHQYVFAVSELTANRTVTLPLLTTNDTFVFATNPATLTNKTIAAGSNTISGLTHGTEVDNPVSGVHGVTGSVVGTSDTQGLTNKTIVAASNTISGLTHGSEVDNPTVAHGATGAIVGTTNSQTLTNKTATAFKMNLSNKTLTDTSGSTTGDQVVFADTTTSILTVTLSTADTIAGQLVIIRDVGGNAGTLNITIDTEGAQLIDGIATNVISVNNDIRRLISDGTNWFTI